MIFKRLLRPLGWLFQPQRKIVFSARLEELRDTAASIDVEFRYATREDLLGLDGAEYGYSETARQFGMERMAAGDRMVLGIHGGKVVYFGWLMFGQMDLSFRNYYSLSRRTAYAYKLYTHPQYRGKKICPAFYAHLKRTLPGQGYERVMCWVASSNEASIRTHKSAGLKEAGSFWQLRVLGSLRFVFDRRMRSLGLEAVEPQQAVGQMA